MEPSTIDKLKSELPEQMHPMLDEIKKKLPEKLHPLLAQRDGAAKLLEGLQEEFKPGDVITRDGGDLKQRAWELAGLFYKNQGRFYDAIPIFVGLYEHMLKAQSEEDSYFHKGMPLVWISECYYQLGFPVLAKKYIMLTLCEDAIQDKGTIKPDRGLYFRIVWQHGMPETELTRYATGMYNKFRESEKQGRFPEWILQEIDKNWMSEVPSNREIAVYNVNKKYVDFLISQLGTGSGKILERLADYVLSCMPGCRTTLRRRSNSTDYDIVCSMEGHDLDFRSELGRYFVCECKDWAKAADFSTIAKFCRVLDSTKSRFGILFSTMGISGKGKTKYAEREQLKVFQDRGMVIVVVDKDDLKRVAMGESFISMLRNKYEKVRLDLI